MPAISGCEKLSFEPSLSATPTTRAAASPSGLDVDLTIPQNEEVNGVATSQLRDATVTLPRGMTLAPGAADGLEACSAQQVGYRASPPETARCPEAAKIGTAEFDVPGLSRVMQGAVYQRTPEAGNLFRIWLVADELGVHVKIPGEIHLDPNTGQVTSLFVDNPQVPLRSLKLHFKGGPRGVLATPFSCGVYRTGFEFTPWSGNAAVAGAAPMTIGEACDTGGFSPRLAAGSDQSDRGPVLAIRARPEARIETNRTSPGSTSRCRPASWPSSPASRSARRRRRRPAICPAASRVGSDHGGRRARHEPALDPPAGQGARRRSTSPARTKAAPYSLVVKTPAQAGPFDLGTVVVRAAI